jgi:hypothetical protein
MVIIISYIMKNAVIILALIAMFALGYFVSQKYDFNIKPKIEEAKKVAVSPTQTPLPSKTPIVGDDTDEYGCKPSAGFTWCESKKKCIKEWEETCDDEEAIAQALATKNGWQSTDIVVTITKFNGKYARGLFNSKSEGGGGIYWAVKKEGSWKIVQDGNGIPDCNILKEEQFPKDFLSGTCE